MHSKYVLGCWVVRRGLYQGPRQVQRLQHAWEVVGGCQRTLCRLIVDVNPRNIESHSSVLYLIRILYIVLYNVIIALSDL